MVTSAFAIAQRFVGVSEAAGATSNPQVLAMLRLDNPGIADDVTPWCSAFVNYVAWLLRLPRSKSLAARSWLGIGGAVELDDARLGDVVVLTRGSGKQPGPEVLKAPGHVGFFAGSVTDQIGAPTHVLVLGGNQGDRVNIERFPVSRLLGIRRIEP